MCAHSQKADCDDASVEDEQHGGLGLPSVQLPGPAFMTMMITWRTSRTSRNGTAAFEL